MAQAMNRAVFTRIGGINCLLGKKVHPLIVSKMAPAAPIQVAGLKATYGGKYPYLDPWPNWQNRKYNMIHEWLDNTSKRLNENSTVIVVDGNIGVGKNSLAKKLAAGFDLKYIESVPDKNAFMVNGFDLRELNYLLPESAQFYDLQKFLSDPHPESGKIGRLQVQWFYAKFMAYAHGLHHLLSTGQGFVMVRSPWSDDVFVDALRRMGYLTPNFMKFYYDLRKNAICELLKPHISIYLDTPISVVKERIKKRGNVGEVDSKILNDKYLMLIDTIYKEKVLRRFRESGHVIEIDWEKEADDLELEVIIEELQRLDMEADPHSHSRFLDWTRNSEDMYCDLRKYFGSKEWMTSLFSVPFPLDCPELDYSEEDSKIVSAVLLEHPIVSERLDNSEKLGQRNLFGIF